MPSIQTPHNGQNYVLIEPDKNATSILDIDKNKITELYRSYGALLFRGFPLDQDIFAHMSQRFCTHPVSNESRGRQVINEAANIQTVNLGKEPFALHPEMSRLPWKPDICFFGCIKAPKAGGETLICDGIEVVKVLPSRVLREFSGKQLLYEAKAQKRYLKYWFGSEHPTLDQLEKPPEGCPFEFVRRAGHIYTRYLTGALHRPMFSHLSAWGNFLLFSRYTKGMKLFPTFEDGAMVPEHLVKVVQLVSEKLQRPIKWQPNDLLILDNTRFMHGRRRIEDVTERLILTYFGFINFAEYSNEYPSDSAWRDPRRWELGID